QGRRRPTAPPSTFFYTCASLSHFYSPETLYTRRAPESKDEGGRGELETGRWREAETGRRPETYHFSPSPRLQLSPSWLHLFLQSGLRFSMKARTPSCASSVFISSLR